MTMKTKILLVDDDTSVLAALTDALEGENFDVRHALDGQEALVVFHAHPDLELVLMDLNMPSRDGWDALHWIRAFDRHLPVIIITGQPDQVDAARGVQPVLISMAGGSRGFVLALRRRRSFIPPCPILTQMSRSVSSTPGWVV